MTALIDQQIGDTFTQKFESLVTRCVWELPKKEEELKTLNSLIIKKRQDMIEITQQVNHMRSTLSEIKAGLTRIRAIMDREVQKWDT